MSKLKIRQDMPPKGGYSPVNWKRYAPKRTVPGYFIASCFVGLSTYCYYKWWLSMFEMRVNEAHHFYMQSKMYPFLHSEEDRRIVRARKQHESDLALICGSDTEMDIHRRTTIQEEVFVPYSSHELRILLNDDERAAMGGEPSRYSVNRMWIPYMWKKEYLVKNSKVNWDKSISDMIEGEQ